MIATKKEKRLSSLIADNKKLYENAIYEIISIILQPNDDVKQCVEKLYKKTSSKAYFLIELKESMYQLLSLYLQLDQKTINSIKVNFKSMPFEENFSKACEESINFYELPNLNNMIYKLLIEIINDFILIVDLQTEILRLFEILLGRTEIRKILINKLKNKIRINYSEICEKIEYFENNYLSDALENQIHYLIDLRDHLHDTKPYQSGKFQFCLIQSENKEKIFKKILKNCELKEDIYHTKYSIILQSATPPIHTSNFASTTSSEENSIHSAPSLLSCVNPIPDSSAPIPQTTISPSSTSIDLNSMQSNSFNASNMNDSSKFNASSSRRKQKFDETIELQIIQQINDLQEEIEFLQIQLRKSQKSNTTIQPPPLQSLSARSHPQSEPEITPVNRSTSLNESMYAQDLSKNHLPTVNASFPHSRDTRSFSIGGAIHYSNNDIISTIPIIPATSSNHSTSTLPNECSNHPSRLKSGSQTGLSASHPLRNQSKSKVPNNEPVVTTEGSALAEKRTSVTRSGSGLQNLIEDIQSNEEIMNNMRVNPPKRNKSTESLDKSGKQTLPSPSVARNTKIMNNNASNSPKISHRTTGSGSGEDLKTKLKNKIKIPGKINLKKKNKGKRGMNFKVEEEEGKKEMSNREKKRSGSYFIENKRETITYNNYIDPSVREKRSLLNSQEIAAKGSPGGGKGSIITTSISNNDIDFLRQREEEKNSNSVNKYLLSHSKSDIQLSNYNEDDIHLSASMSILEELENDKRVIKPIFRTASAPKYLTISDMDQLNSLIPPLSPPTLPSSKSSTLSEHPNHKGNAGGKTNDASGGIVNNSPLHSPGKKEPLGSLNEYSQSMIESTGMELPNIDSFDYSFPNRNKMLNVNMKEEMSLAYSPPPNHRMSMYLKPKAKKTKIPPILDSKTQKSNSESSIMWPSGKTNQTHAHTQQLYRAHASESTLPSSHNQAWNEEIIANQEARNVQTIGSGSSNYLNEENVDFPKLPELLPASTIQFRRSLGSINYPQAAQHPSPPMDDGYPSLSSPTSTGIPHSRSSSSLLHLPLSEVSSIPIIPDSLASLLHSPLNLSNPSASPPTTPQNGYMYGPNSPLKSFSDPIKQSSGEGGIPLPIPNLEHVTLALNEGEPLDKITRMKLVSPPPVGAAASKVSDLTNPSLNRIKLSHVEDSELPAKCASEQDYPLENDGTPFSPISRSFSHHSFVFPAHSGSSAQLMGKRKERTKIKQILQEGGASTKLIFEENPQSRQGRGGSVVHPHPYQPPNPYHHHHQPLPSHAHAGGATPLSIVLPTTLPSVAPGGGGGSPTKAAMSKNRGRTSKKDDLDEINFNMSPGAGKRSDGISFEYEYTQESELYLSKLTSDSDLLKLMQQPNNLIKVSSEIQIEDGMGRTNQNNKPKVFDKIELNEEKELPVDFWFSHFFYGKFYETFLLRSPLDAILTFKKEKINKNLFYRILLRTKEQSSGILVPFSSLSFSRNSLRILSKYKLLSNMLQLLHVEGTINKKKFCKLEEEIGEELLKFEELEISHIVNEKKFFKFGILNWQAGNKNEEDLFSNQSISPDLQDFLNLIGKKIELLNWEGYDGGLDTSDKSSTGTFSIFTNFENSHIMFHVAPFLPYSSTDHQQLERKRHIGNDIAIIVFNESNEPFDTSLITSQFVHVIIVISVETSAKGRKMYRVSVSSKKDFPNFPPHLPDSGLFFTCAQFRKFLFRKLINAEKASNFAPAFASRIKTSRMRTINGILDQHLPPERDF